MRDNWCPGLELVPQPRTQLAVVVPLQEKRYHRRVAELRLEEIALHEPHAVSDARRACVLDRVADAVRVDVDADATRAELPRRSDHDAAVAAAEVVDDVGRVDVRGLEHRVDDLVRRGNEVDLQTELVLRVDRLSEEARGGACGRQGGGQSERLAAGVHLALGRPYLRGAFLPVTIRPSHR